MPLYAVLCRFVPLGAMPSADHVIVFNQDRSWRQLRDDVNAYNTERVHTVIRDASDGRAIQTRPSSDADVVGLPCVGDLHRRYHWQEAA